MVQNNTRIYLLIPLWNRLIVPLSVVTPTVTGSVATTVLLVSIWIRFECSCPEQEATEDAREDKEGVKSGRLRLDHCVLSTGWGESNIPMFNTDVQIHLMAII